MPDDWREKLDVRGRYELAEGRLRDPLEVLIRTEAPLTARQRGELIEAGCELLTAAGTVLSGTVADPKRLERIAGLRFVQRIEVSRAMHQE
jgi:hypothetical protein